WDHVSPPNNNGIWGDGTRVPGIVISPFAKQGFVDHTEHDTLSILSTIEKRFGLTPLNSLDAKASTLESSFQSTPKVSLGFAYLQPDADNPGKFALIVEGTEGSDHISVGPATGGLRVQINTTAFDQSFLADISRIEVYTQGGNDHVEIASTVTT